MGEVIDCRLTFMRKHILTKAVRQGRESGELPKPRFEREVDIRVVHDEEINRRIQEFADRMDMKRKEAQEWFAPLDDPIAANEDPMADYDQWDLGYDDDFDDDDGGDCA